MKAFIRFRDGTTMTGSASWQDQGPIILITEDKTYYYISWSAVQWIKKL